MPASSTLQELHRAIQCLFAWDNSHLHRFYRRAPQLPPYWLEDSPHLTPEQIYDLIIRQQEVDEWLDLGVSAGFGLPDVRAHDETTTLISLVLTAATPRLSYQYDFGDNWDHTVQLERVLAAGSQRRPHYPICIGGRKRAPPPVRPTYDSWAYDKISIPDVNAKLRRIPDIDWTLGAGGAFVPADQPEEPDSGEDYDDDDDELEEQEELEKEEKEEETGRRDDTAQAAAQTAPSH